MPRNDAIQQILEMNSHIWDHPGFRTVARENFIKVLQCGTPALGSEVYASDFEQKLVHHTCKSRACTSCGHRSTQLWQREQWASLPDVPFAGITLTMPDVLWSIFKRNRHLHNDLPALGGIVLRRLVKEKYGVEVMIMVVPHTFGHHLNFNCHLHVLVSTEGLREADLTWVRSIEFDNDALMNKWKYTVITYLRDALKAGVLQTELDDSAVKAMLTAQYERWWNVDIKTCVSKKHFLTYAARYVRRPPLAQYRILSFTDEEVRFRIMDTKLGREVIKIQTPGEFIHALADHVPDHYKHAMRYFGPLAPRSKHHTSALILAATGQQKQPKPKHVSFNYSIARAFGVDPLLDSRGQRMRLIGRRAAA